MADRTAMPPDPVAGLIDFPLPREVSLWPQTWEARLAVVVLLAAAVVGAWSLMRYRRVTRYRREALSELKHIGRASPDEMLTGLTLLVRRTALARYPREQVAPLFGRSWLAFLDQSYGGKEFSEGEGRLLVSGPYQQIAPSEAELKSLVVLVRRWIRHHA